MAEHARNGAVDLPRFYGRRSLRLMPELVVFLAVLAFVVAPVLGQPLPWLQAVAALTYWTNYFILSGLGDCANCATTGHLWSLGGGGALLPAHAARHWWPAPSRRDGLLWPAGGGDRRGRGLALDRLRPLRMGGDLHLQGHRVPDRLHRLGLPGRRGPARLAVGDGAGSASMRGSCSASAGSCSPPRWPGATRCSAPRSRLFRCRRRRWC